MNKKFLTFLILLFVSFMLVGCSQEQVEESDVKDETVFTPPEQEGTLVGTWTTQQDELTANQYFYNDGKLVSIYQDPEEQTWVSLSYWNDENNKITLNDQKFYRYNIDSDNWNEESSNVVKFVSGKKENDETLVTEETLPDGNTVEFTYKRGLTDITIPGEIEITSDINAFLIH